MAPFFARCCLVAAGMWLSAGHDTFNSTRRRLAGGHSPYHSTGQSLGAGQNMSNTSNTTGQPAAAALARAAEPLEAESKALLRSKDEMDARVEWIRSSLNLASRSRQRAISELAKAREEREKQSKVLEKARADLKEVKDEFVESVRDSIHGVSGGAFARPMALADDAVVYAEATVRDAVRGVRNASEQTAVAVQHSLEAEALAKAMELKLKTEASFLTHDVGDMRAMNTSLDAQKLHELAVQARLVPEENATEEGVMPQLNQTIERMEMALREAYEQGSHAQQRADAVAAKEKHVQKKGNVLDAMAAKEKRSAKQVTVIVNHSRALKGHQNSSVAQSNESQVVQSNETAGAVQQKTKKWHYTKHQSQHTAEAEAVEERHNSTTNKTSSTKHHKHDKGHAEQPVLRAGKRWKARK